MIVWGGTDGSGITYFNTGRRYNPSSDTWTATNTTNAPAPRYAHTAVWSGTEMIVWSGGNSGGLLNTGGRYDPSTDSWTATSTTNAPSARVNHTAVWTGSEMIVWGGLFIDISGAHYVNTGGRYCAEAGATPTPTPTPTPESLTLSAQKKKVHTLNTVRLTWTGGTSANIDVYRNGVVIATTANGGVYDDFTGDTGEAQYAYMVCEAGTQTCSNEVLVRFPPTGSATWSMNPVSGDWNNPLNWTPNTVPDGPSATATFAVSNITDISLSDAIGIGAIVFNVGASPFTITRPKELTISGAGITNNSGVTQNFVSTVSSEHIKFIHSATAGSETTFTNSNGYIEFRDTANPGTATFVTSNGGNTIFFDGAKSDNGTFIANSGGTTSPNFHNGANGTCISNAGATTYFGDGDRAGNATLIANGGSIEFDSSSQGGTPRVELFGNSLLYLTNTGGLSVGSIEGDGIIEMGDWVLRVGTNGLSTVFNGLLHDEVSEEFGGTLHKVGPGSLTLSSANTYRNGTVISGGALFVTNTTGSATGDDIVSVNAGTLGGSGIIAGPVVIGSGSGTAAFLALSKGADEPVALTLQRTLTFNMDGIYIYELNTQRATADQVIANGVTIQSGAQFNLRTVGGAKLPIGQVFTAISNTSANPISGTFSNLADGSIITIGSNTFQANYEGGDGNDLTLTVVP
jgi:autotransporter-associated beta strand protein